MLIDVVKKDIELFFASNRELLFNERDLQMRLAHLLLNSGHYDDVDLEYHLPIGFKETFDKDYEQWETEKPSLDVVVRKGDEYVPVELKYKLKAVRGAISRFGEQSQDPNLEIIPNQSAQNLGRYAFWKDVKRIELVKKHYSKVHSGLAVFLTNDPSYLDAKEGADYYAFSMKEGHVASGQFDWRTPKDKYPPITLNGNYLITWHKISPPCHKLMPTAYYTMVQI